ncbi:MAG: MarR family transcriptional regulator [Clostridia bacterium]|nr:MarR family transcriptional regulator [Clostridia bacterium]
MNNLDFTIFDKFKDIANRLSLIQKEVAEKLKLNWGYLKVLTALANQEGLSQTKLSFSCGLDKPATSRLIIKMTSDNLIKKYYKDNNKKTTCLFLTEAGKKLAEKISQIKQKLQKKYFNVLNNKDKETFNLLLTSYLK